MDGVCASKCKIFVCSNENFDDVVCIVCSFPPCIYIYIAFPTPSRFSPWRSVFFGTPRSPAQWQNGGLALALLFSMSVSVCAWWLCMCPCGIDLRCHDNRWGNAVKRGAFPLLPHRRYNSRALSIFAPFRTARDKSCFPHEPRDAKWEDDGNGRCLDKSDRIDSRIFSPAIVFH